MQPTAFSISILLQRKASSVKAHAINQQKVYLFCITADHALEFTAKAKTLNMKKSRQMYIHLH